jgi:hypothetical protein
MNTVKKLIVLVSLSSISPLCFAITETQVFAFAEANYPGLFTGTSTTGQYQQYNFRYYADNDNYLALDSSGEIFILGPILTENKITSVGMVTDYASAIIAWEATTGGTTNSASLSPPANVMVAKVNSQTVGTNTFSSSTKLAVTWAAPTDYTVEHYAIRASESTGNTSVSANANVTSATLSGLKSGTDYSIVVTACTDTACSQAGAASAVTGRTSEEYWQIQGGNSYATATQIIDSGGSLPYARKVPATASSYAEYSVFYYNPRGSQEFKSGMRIGITMDMGNDYSTISNYTNTIEGGVYGAESSNCPVAPNKPSECSLEDSFVLSAGQAISLKSGVTRLFFEGHYTLENGSPLRNFYLDSVDGLVGIDFNKDQLKTVCSRGDYISGGDCEATKFIGVSGDSDIQESYLSNVRQSKIGFATLDSSVWDESVGTFIIITGSDSCGISDNGLFYASYDGSNWNTKTDGGCATPMAKYAHGPVIQHLGASKYKLYYEDETPVNGSSSASHEKKPLHLIYADGGSGSVQFEDWEQSSLAREVHFLWSDGVLLTANEESGLGDHMIYVPSGNLDEQYMYLNLGGFDNSDWAKPSVGTGIAKLLNP